jgi:hypothetical protein
MLEEMVSLKWPDKQAQPRRQTKWQKPEDGWVKINTDAAFDTTTCTGSGGVVIRDHEGAVLAGEARWFDHVSNAFTAEALAAKEGLELAMENGYNRVILEVDCSNLKMMLGADNGMRSTIGGLCFDITELGRNFIDFKVAWVCREANSVAHYCVTMVSHTERAIF